MQKLGFSEASPGTETTKDNIFISIHACRKIMCRDREGAYLRQGPPSMLEYILICYATKYPSSGYDIYIYRYSK